MAALLPGDRAKSAPLSRADIEAIGRSVNKPASTIYRWRNDNPPLFEAVREYATREIAESRNGS